MAAHTTGPIGLEAPSGAREDPRDAQLVGEPVDSADERHLKVLGPLGKVRVLGSPAQDAEDPNHDQGRQDKAEVGRQGFGRLVAIGKLVLGTFGELVTSGPLGSHIIMSIKSSLIAHKSPRTSRYRDESER
ncbi:MULTISPECIES: hypothetical protein [Sorangium]|uniref:Uncharacterized protein n=1 Tax=Sorangium cellulosum TaxID=56 RepID=A0A4P2QPS5_SORCE|nr:MULTISPECIES: hypothetical protein [Sorangium]AUX31948.1 uncharacterized protein SOCE836_040830 [Sorangium cellulosum]WCQ91322.1 hypothetical protein NQZ70_04038 [Sorangium sp. Soce836]